MQSRIIFLELPMKIKRSAALVAVPLSVMAVQAHAALPAGVTSAIEAVGTDLETAATAVLAAMVAFWGLRKLGSKMGWW